MSLEALEGVKERFAGAVLSTHALHGDETAIVDAARIGEIAAFVRDELGFDMLVDLTVLDTLGLNPGVSRTIGACGDGGGPENSRAFETPATIPGASVAVSPLPHPTQGRFQVV